MKNFWTGFEKRASPPMSVGGLVSEASTLANKTSPPWMAAKKITSWAPNPGVRSVAKGINVKALSTMPVAPTSARTALRRAMTGAMAKLGAVNPKDVEKAKGLLPKVLAHFEPKPGYSTAGISIKGLKSMYVQPSSAKEVATRQRREALKRIYGQRTRPKTT